MQVKPFILRRTKDRVLADLPPKILQDVYVDPSPLQRLLYQDFARSDASQQVQGVIKTEQPTESVADKAPHVFQVSCYQSLSHTRLHISAHHQPITKNFTRCTHLQLQLFVHLDRPFAIFGICSTDVSCTTKSPIGGLALALPVLQEFQGGRK